MKKKSNGLLKNISVQCDLMICKDFPLGILKENSTEKN